MTDSKCSGITEEIVKGERVIATVMRNVPASIRSRMTV